MPVTLLNHYKHDNRYFIFFFEKNRDFFADESGFEGHPRPRKRWDEI